MGSNNQQLEFVVKAVDDASKELEKVREAVSKLQSGVDGASQSMEKASSEIDKVSGQHQNMAKEVMKGVAAWDLLKEGARMTADFIHESVNEFLDAQKKLDLTRATVESMGMSFQKAQPILQEFGDRMVSLGVDGEDVQVSAAKLAKLAGGDLQEGLKLAKLASDLTSSGFGDLESNTDRLASVLAGRGTFAAREYNIQLADTATTADILNQIQGKVTQTTEQYAQTIPGRIAVVKRAYAELQQQVGEGFVVAVSNAIGKTNEFDNTLGNMKDIATALKVVVFEVTNGFLAVGQAIGLAGRAIGYGINAWDALTEAMSGNIDVAKAIFKSNSDDFNESFGSLKKTIQDLMHPISALNEAEKSLAANHTSTAGTIKGSFDGITNAQKGAVKDLMSHSDAVKLLTDAYNDMTSKAVTDLATLSDEHLKTMTDIQKSIATTQKAINDLNSAYNRQQTDDASGMADKIVASQQKVSDLKKQIASTDDNVKKADLQKQLDTEQAGLDAVAGFTKDNQAAILESKRRAALTQLQRDVEDYNKRKVLQTQEYNDKLATLQQQLADQQAQQTKEIELYNAKTKKIAEFTKAATDDYITASQTRIQQTKDEVNQEIQAFAALASAISAVRTASASAVTTYSVPNFGGKREMGGPVQMKTSYLVGERGPEIFVPSSDGTIVPNHALGSNVGGGGNVIVNITGNTISDQVGVKYLADRVGAEIMRVLRLNQKVSI